jgi:hypothetical protein
MPIEDQKFQQDQRDRELIERAGLIPGGQDTLSRRAFAQLIIDLRNAMTGQSEAAGTLGNKIWWLNLWLLIFTIFIAVLTGVLVWMAFREGFK